MCAEFMMDFCPSKWNKQWLFSGIYSSCFQTPQLLEFALQSERQIGACNFLKCFPVLRATCIRCCSERTEVVCWCSVWVWDTFQRITLRKWLIVQNAIMQCFKLLQISMFCYWHCCLGSVSYDLALAKIMPGIYSFI